MHTIICKNCHQKFEKNQPRKFCSVKCSGEFNGRNGIVGGNTSSLDAFIKKYGPDVGPIKHKEKSDKLSKIQTGRQPHNKGKKTSEETKKKISEAVKNSDTHKAYIKQIRDNGFPEEKKEHLRQYMKGMFSLEWFIEKHGEIDGKIKYEERRNSISKTSYFRVFNKMNRQNYSKKSQRLFWELYNRLCLQNQKIYFGDLNHEYGCGMNTNFDFVMLEKKKVIEFNGNIWHANPKYFNEQDHIRVWNMSAKEVWEKDKKRIDEVKQKGFDVLIVWESDFDCNKKEIIETCVEFLIS